MPHSFDHRVEKVRSPGSATALLGRFLCAGCALWWLAGCATEVAPPGSRFVVSAPMAEFYKNGPAEDANLDFGRHTFDNSVTEQHTGPDFQLPKGAHVTMLKREYGYSRVVTDNGVTGYVANEKLQPAPAVARMAPADIPVNGRFHERVRSNNDNHPHLRQPDEHLDLNDLPLPLPG